MDLGLTPQTGKKISAGKFYPLGESLYEDGVNFAIYSKYAKEVFLLHGTTLNSEPYVISSMEVKGKKWLRVADTSIKSGEDFLAIGEEIPLEPDESYVVNPRSTVALLSK